MKSVTLALRRYSDRGTMGVNGKYNLGNGEENYEFNLIKLVRLYFFFGRGR